MPDDILAALNLVPADVPTLPSNVRTSLIAYLLRWEHHDAAGRCLQQLLISHSHLVSVYDALVRLSLAQKQPDRALEMMRLRHAIRTSNSSLVLEARVHLAAGDLPSARAIADRMRREQPEMLLTWSLRAALCLASGDQDGAEAAWQRREALRPGTSATAQGIAQVWQSRGDLEKSLLWARTALARTDRDGRQPPVDLLRLLESLYHATGQSTQAKATADHLRRRQEQELKELRQALDTTQFCIEPQPSDQPAGQPVFSPVPIPDRREDAPLVTRVLTGAPDLAPDEQARLDEALHSRFGHETFRTGQAGAIAAILRGESVLTVMPTGAGKSLCYQLAALLLPGTTLVISPLIALMKDQLDGLPAEVAAQATTINSTLDGPEMESRLARAASGGYKILYAAPERLRQRPFLQALKRAGISLLVVDEAHCVSLWGHDFRPDYRFIAKAWHELGQPPILAMTATATPRVRDDIQAALDKMRLVDVDVHRPNLKLEARRFASDAAKRPSLLALCHEIKGSGIIYAHSRARCEQLAAMLRQDGISAIHYHAGVQNRAATQDRFMCDQVRIVVATIAFGMGVDKADVRFIVHYSPPKALENYYQEAGRAGRDGLPARCILFHSPGDRSRLTHFCTQEALQVDFLRRAYAAIQRRVGASGVGLVTAGDLERDLVADDTQVRVAIHFLETAGLLWRGFDLPRTASLTLMRAPDGEDPDLARFVEAGRLQIRQAVSRDLVALSHDAGLDPRAVETSLLAWNDAGWLRYRGIGRDMLLALPEPPPDSQERVAAMLAEYHAGQEGRIAEMMAYATTDRCRHGTIGTYFGGRPIERCQACDNCLGERVAPPRPARRRAPVSRPAVTEELSAIILNGVAKLPFPLGRRGLARALQGAPTSSVSASRFSMFGILSSWTQKGISDLVAQLEGQGLLVPLEKDGYRLLRLSTAGQDWLRARPRDMATVPAPQPRDIATTGAAQAEPQTENLADYDRALFERLRAWRLEKAREMGKPPFVVLHDQVLKGIAAACPTTAQDLAGVKGIGSRKLEQYGRDILELVARHRAHSSPDNP